MALRKSVLIRTGITAFLVALFASWQFSIYTVLLFVGFYVFDAYRRDLAQRRKDAVHIERMAQQFAVLQKLLGNNIPEWVNFSTTEKCLWLNDMLLQLWPYAKRATETVMQQSLNPVFKEFKPSFLTKLGFHKCDMGHKPPMITGLDTSEGPDGIYLDISLKMSGSSNIVIEAGRGVATVTAGLRNLEVVGVMRVCLAPLTDKLPVVRAVAISFLHKPRITYQLSAGKVPLTSIPGLTSFLDGFIKSTLAELLVWPRRLPVPLAELTPDELHAVSYSTPKGLLRVWVRGANGITNVLGTTDPYASVQLLGGANVKFHTHTIKDTLAPVFNSKFEFLVSDPGSQLLNVSIKHDGFGPDKHIGFVELDVASMEADVQQELSLPLQEGSGTVDLVVEYKPFMQRAPGPDTSSVSDAVLDTWTPAHSLSPSADDKSEVPLRNGRLFVHVRRLLGLKSQDATHVDLRCGAVARRTKDVRGMAEPEANEHFSFSLSEVTTDRLLVALAGANTGRTQISLATDVFPAGSAGLTKVFPLDSGCAVELNLSVQYVDPETFTTAAAKEQRRGVTDRKAAHAALSATDAEEAGLAQATAEQRARPVDSIPLIAGKVFGALFVIYLVVRIFGFFSIAAFLLVPAAAAGLAWDAERRSQARVLRVTGSNAGKELELGRDKLDAVALGRQRQKLPLWAKYPDMEKQEWLNQLLESLWPSVKPAVEAIVHEQVGAVLREKKPPQLSGLRLKAVSIGSLPPIISGWRHYQRAQQGEQVILDLELRLAGDAFATVEIGFKKFTFTVSVADLAFSGTLRVAMRHLVPAYPCFSEVHISFVAPPQVDFSLQLGVLPLMSIPGVPQIRDHFLNDILSQQLVYPQTIAVPIMEPAVVQALLMKRGEGLLRIRVDSGTNLRNVEAMGKSDPYCLVIYHEEGRALEWRTRTISGTLNPVWNERTEFIVSDTSCPLTFTVKDAEVSGDRMLAEGESVHISELPAHTLVKRRLRLMWKGKRAGAVHVQLEWKPFDAAVNTDIQPDAEQWSTAMLYVRIDRCRHLLSDKSSVHLTLGSCHESTPVVEGNNPVFESNVKFPVRDCRAQKLRVEVKDGKDVVGKVDIGVKDIIKSGSLQGTWVLEGASQGEIDLGMLLRTVAPTPSPRPMLDQGEMITSCGVLRVRVVGGEGLLNVERVGRSDPFVILTMPENPPVSYRTEWKSGTLDPVWGDKFEFVVSDATMQLQFDVRDHEKLGTHRPMGVCLAPAVNVLPADTLVRRRLPLLIRGTKHGFLIVELEWKPFEAKPVITEGPNPEGWANALLYCDIRSCAMLPTPDAYVKATVGAQHGQTPTLLGTDLQFNEMLPFLVHDLGTEQIQLDVCGAKGADLGHFTVPLREAAVDGGFSRVVGLTGVAQGTLGLGLTLRTLAAARAGTLGEDVWLYDASEAETVEGGDAAAAANGDDPANGAAAAAAAADSAAAPAGDATEVEAAGAAADTAASPPRPTGAAAAAATASPGSVPRMPTAASTTSMRMLSPARVLRPGHLTVTVVKGSNLPPANSNGFSDPYVTAKVEGKKQKTKHMKKTLNPVFNEVLQFTVWEPSTSVLAIKVKDWEQFARNKTLGKLAIPISDVTTTSTKDYRLTGMNARGTLTLTLAYVEMSEEEASKAPKRTGSRGIFHRKPKDDDDSSDESRPTSEIASSSIVNDSLVAADVAAEASGDAAAASTAAVDAVAVEVTDATTTAASDVAAAAGGSVPATSTTFVDL